MTEEPYRWLEAISNRREYIRDQLKGGTPVFAVSRPEGILLLGVGQGQSKVFEIYDRHGLAALGHPVDIEKLRQGAIEAAHLEGFNRSARDVTLRRLISFSLSSMLKNAFEQVFAPPFIVESIFAELGETEAQDTLVRLHYDGDHYYSSSRVVVAHRDGSTDAEAAEWISKALTPSDPLPRVAGICLSAWQLLHDNKSFQGVTAPAETQLQIPGRVIEAALLDRQRPAPVHYRSLDFDRATSIPK
jgi:proteasome alpha subunit